MAGLRARKDGCISGLAVTGPGRPDDAAKHGDSLATPGRGARRWVAPLLLSVTALSVFAWWFRRFSALTGLEPAATSMDVRPPASTGTQKEEPLVYGFRVARKYRHDPTSFTQGLVWANGSLYESTGLYGRSLVREVRLEGNNSVVVREVGQDRSDFGEGLIHWRGELLQLLWHTGQGRRYSAQAGEGGHLKKLLPDSFRTPRSDGWGLATDGEMLYMTDSGSKVFTLDPETYAQRAVVTVSDGGEPVEMLNELEVIDGDLWANIFGNECLARIALDGTGSVLGWAVLDGMFNWKKARAQAKRAKRDLPDVMNGIAWDAEARRLFLTGKFWPLLYEVELVPNASMSVDEVRRRCLPTRNIFHE